MKLRQKILVAFIIMIVVPGMLVGRIYSLSVHYELKQLTGSYKAGDVGRLFDSPTEVFAESISPEVSELTSSLKRNPEKTGDMAWLGSINDRLQTKCSFLIIFKNDIPVYFGGDEYYREFLGSVYEDLANVRTDAVIMDTGLGVLLSHNIIQSGEGTITVAVITELGRFTQLIRRAIIIGAAIAMLCIAVTAIILIIWLYEGIIKPIDSLKKATKLIGAGNLNFRLERTESDEIGELCNDFEEMRRHLKTQIDQKEQYEQDIREMISNVSHDLKTPLTAIKGYAEGMLDGVADTPERREKYLKTIMYRANDMTLLVDELSYYSKLDNNKLAYNFENVDAVGYFKDCVDEYAVELEMKDFTVSFISEITEGQKVVIDVEQIRRVMNNLIGNAVKYRREDIHGELTVKLTDAGKSVRISVIDNGIGISKEAQPHIFERFYRADKSRTSGRAGTGIGLAIVKKIVEEHQGRTFVKSQIGKGTTISFTVKKGA